MSGPSLLIESTDSMMIIVTKIVILNMSRLVGMALTAAMGVLLLFLGCAINFPGER